MSSGKSVNFHLLNVINRLLLCKLHAAQTEPSSTAPSSVFGGSSLHDPQGHLLLASLLRLLQGMPAFVRVGTGNNEIE